MHVRHFAPLATVLALALASSSLVAQPGRPSTVSTGDTARSTISVTGLGEVRVTPDRAYVTVGVQSRAETAAEAAAENARRQSAILDTLRTMGYGASQLMTTNFSVYPDMQTDDRGQRPRIVGYVVSNSVRVEVRQVAQVGRVLDAALARGANEVQGVNFFLADPDPVRRRAIADAVSKARLDAEALAAAAGGTVGRVLHVATGGPPMQPMFGGVAMARGGDMKMETPIAPGEEAVQAFVSIVYEFRARR